MLALPNFENQKSSRTEYHPRKNESPCYTSSGCPQVAKFTEDNE